MHRFSDDIRDMCIKSYTHIEVTSGGNIEYLGITLKVDKINAVSIKGAYAMIINTLIGRVEFQWREYLDMWGQYEVTQSIHFSLVPSFSLACFYSEKELK